MFLLQRLGAPSYNRKVLMTTKIAALQGVCGYKLQLPALLYQSFIDGRYCFDFIASSHALWFLTKPVDFAEVINF